MSFESAPDPWRSFRSRRSKTSRCTGPWWRWIRFPTRTPCTWTSSGRLARTTYARSSCVSRCSTGRRSYFGTWTDSRPRRSPACSTHRSEQFSRGCTEAVRQLWDYLDKSISAEDQERVEKHLSFCRTCCGELEFAKELRSFLASNEAEEIPPDVKAHLERFVQEL